MESSIGRKEERFAQTGRPAKGFGQSLFLWGSGAAQEEGEGFFPQYRFDRISLFGRTRTRLLPTPKLGGRRRNEKRHTTFLASKSPLAARKAWAAFCCAKIEGTFWGRPLVCCARIGALLLLNPTTGHPNRFLPQAKLRSCQDRKGLDEKGCGLPEPFNVMGRIFHVHPNSFVCGSCILCLEKQSDKKISATA